MSGKIAGMVWDLDLPHNQLFVLLALADHADHEGKNVYPSLGLIAWKTGYSEQQVRRVIKLLVESNILIPISREPGKTNRYSIDLSKGKLKPERKVTPTKMSGVSKSNPLHREGGAKGLTPDMPSLKKSDEPYSEPSSNTNTNTSATSAGFSSIPVEEKAFAAFDEFVDTLDIDTSKPIDRIPDDELEPMPPYVEPPLVLHECKSTDIAEMIAAWWEWVPVRPAMKGRVSQLADFMKIPTNREYAENLFKRGVRPIDFVRVLAPMRRKFLAGDKTFKEMPFQYVCPMVDEYVGQNRRSERGLFTQESPRWAAKKPGAAVVHFGEDLWLRDDLFLDLAPRYFSIAELTAQETETEDYTEQPTEYDSWTADDWEKDGNPL